MSEKSQLHRQIAEIAALQQQRLIDEEIERKSKLVSMMFNEAKRYTNVVITLGFAAYFTMLGAFRDGISLLTLAGSACAVITSLMIYIGFEVYKIVFTSILSKRYASTLEPGASVDALNAMDEANHASSRTLMKVWTVIIGPCIALGFGGALWLAGDIFYIFLNEIGVIEALSDFFSK